MPPNPLNVSKPFLIGSPSIDVEYFDAIEAFAKDRFVSLARSAIARLQRWPATDTFEGETQNVKSLWDEFCWYCHKYDSDCGLLSSGMEQSVDSILVGSVDALDYTEAVLLSCAASEDQNHMPASDESLLREVLRGMLIEAAMDRDVEQFEAL